MRMVDRLSKPFSPGKPSNLPMRFEEAFGRGEPAWRDSRSWGQSRQSTTEWANGHLYHDRSTRSLRQYFQKLLRDLVIARNGSRESPRFLT